MSGHEKREREKGPFEVHFKAQLNPQPSLSPRLPHPLPRISPAAAARILCLSRISPAAAAYARARRRLRLPQPV